MEDKKRAVNGIYDCPSGRKSERDRLKNLPTGSKPFAAAVGSGDPAPDQRTTGSFTAVAPCACIDASAFGVSFRMKKEDFECAD